MPHSYVIPIYIYICRGIHRCTDQCFSYSRPIVYKYKCLPRRHRQRFKDSKIQTRATGPLQSKDSQRETAWPNHSKFEAWRRLRRQVFRRHLSSLYFEDLPLLLGLPRLGLPLEGLLWSVPSINLISSSMLRESMPEGLPNCELLFGPTDTLGAVAEAW